MTLSANKIRTEYDRIAPFFSMGSALTFPFRRSLFERYVLPKVRLGPGSSVLEVCCGAGHNFPYILRAIGAEGRLTAIDFSENMLAQARSRVERNGWPNVTLLWGDAVRVNELVQESQDLVLCSLALSLIPDRLRVLHAIRALLKPEGQLAVIEAQPFSGLAAILNPLLYASMLPVPSNNDAIFHEAPRTLDCIKQVFPGFTYTEHYSGSIYVGVADARGGT